MGNLREMLQSAADAVDIRKQYDVRPIGTRLFVEVMKNQDWKTEGGVVIPGAADVETLRGTVIAVGDGTLLNDGTRAPMTIEVGDIVIFGKGTLVNLNIGENIGLIDGHNVLAVITEKQ